MLPVVPTEAVFRIFLMDGWIEGLLEKIIVKC